MNTKEKVIVSAAFVILAGISIIGLTKGVVSSELSKLQLNFGSTDRASLYQATTTNNTWDAQALIVGGRKLLACGAGDLGSVVITNETAGSFTLYDATTTVNGAIYGTTTLAKTYVAQAEGTYTYDVGFRYGLLVEFQSSNVASSTITFRGNPVCQ